MKNPVNFCRLNLLYHSPVIANKSVSSPFTCSVFMYSELLLSSVHQMCNANTSLRDSVYSTNDRQTRE